MKIFCFILIKSIPFHLETNTKNLSSEECFKETVFFI